MLKCLSVGLSVRTIEYTNAVLQSAFRQAVRWKMLAEDPCVGVDLPRMRRREMEGNGVTTASSVLPNPAFLRDSSSGRTNAILSSIGSCS
jgi:hypothetical protein